MSGECEKQKKCGQCGDSFPLDGFRRNSSTCDGRQHRCIACAKRSYKDYAGRLKAGDRTPKKPAPTDPLKTCDQCLARKGVGQFQGGTSKVCRLCQTHIDCVTWYEEMRENVIRRRASLGNAAWIDVEQDLIARLRRHGAMKIGKWVYRWDDSDRRIVRLPAQKGTPQLHLRETLRAFRTPDVLMADLRGRNAWGE